MTNGGTGSSLTFSLKALLEIETGIGELYSLFLSGTNPPRLRHSSSREGFVFTHSVANNRGVVWGSEGIIALLSSYPFNDAVIAPSYAWSFAETEEMLCPSSSAWL
jgi:hypothetical protein